MSLPARHLLTVQGVRGINIAAPVDPSTLHTAPSRQLFSLVVFSSAPLAPYSMSFVSRVRVARLLSSSQCSSLHTGRGDRGVRFAGHGFRFSPALNSIFELTLGIARVPETKSKDHAGPDISTARQEHARF